MLRLNPTQIRLEKSDLNWHLPRHTERQARRAAVPRHDTANGIKRVTPQQQRKIGFPDSSPSPSVPLSAKYSDPYSGPETEIYSDDPIPHQDRAYWDKFFAQIGSPTTLQATPTARATVVDPSHDFLDTTHSERASIEQGSFLTDDDPDNEPHNSFDAPAGDLFTSDSSSSTRVPGTNALLLEQRSTQEEAAQSSSSGQRHSWNLFGRGTHKAPEEPHGFRALLGRVTHSLSGSMAVDGPPDRHSSHDRYSSRSSSGGMDLDLNDGLYGSRKDRRTFSGATSRDDRAGENPESTSYRLPIRPILPPPRAVGHSRNMSGNLPRSSLYISEAAASSSPERRPRTPSDQNVDVSENRGLLSLPPRRPRTYRARSQTYSFAESEGLPDPTIPQLDGPAAARAITNRLPSVLVSHPPTFPGTSPDHRLASQQISSPSRQDLSPYLGSSPPDLPANWGQSMYTFPTSPNGSNFSPASPQDPIEIRSYHSMSSVLSSHSRAPPASSPVDSSPFISNGHQPTVSQRNLSPYAPPFVPQSARRSGSPMLFLPPPFSATSRHVSISSTYPPSSPASPHTPPQRAPSNSVSPFAAPVSRRIPVYNDRLSPSLQPQTPAGLPRHGVAAMATHNPFNTAPIGGLHRNRALAQWQAFATPTRRPNARARNNRVFGGPEADQENEGQVTQPEAATRREMREDSWGLQDGDREWGTPSL